jgi:predicted PurR-regulated permease PerM
MEAIASIIGILSAGGSAAVIVILALIVVYFTWEHIRMLRTIDKYQQMITNNRDQYTDSIIEIVDRYHKGNIEMIQALNEIKVVLAALHKSIT